MPRLDKEYSEYLKGNCENYNQPLISALEEMEKGGEAMVYTMIILDKNNRKEVPLGCKTDRGARIKAKQYAKIHKIRKYGIIFYRGEDAFRGCIYIE